MSVISSANTVLDISGYNSFNLQCDARFGYHSIRANESFKFVWKKNNETLNQIHVVSTDSLNYSDSDVSQNSLVQQNASSSQHLVHIVYSCFVVFSINGSFIVSRSNSTLVIVKGELTIFYTCTDYTYIY